MLEIKAKLEFKAERTSSTWAFKFKF